MVQYRSWLYSLPNINFHHQYLQNSLLQMRNKHPITKDEPQENINRRSTILSRDYWVLTIHILAQKFGIDDIIDWKVD